MAYGDGIGPEIMSVVLNILRKAGLDFQAEPVEMGEKVYKKGFPAGCRPEDWDKIRKNRVFLKAPVTTPQGGGFKSLNVKVRKSLGLFANVRPVQSLAPYVQSLFSRMDVVIVRENEEGLYAGIEHRQTQDVFQCLKLVSLSGCEKIVRYGFEYAARNGRKKVTCMTKDNIMKLTDGSFRKVFERVAKEYPDLQSEHWIIDIGAAKFSASPEDFDLIILPNLYGDILSDISAHLAGSVGLGGSGNIGQSHAMFEAIHGSAPRRAGQDMANPSGLLNGAIMMLSHIGESSLAEKIHNAWLKSIEEGVHTYDIYNEETSRQKVGTKDFGRAVVENLGDRPKNLPPSRFSSGAGGGITISVPKPPLEEKTLDGVDVFVCEGEGDVRRLASRLTKAGDRHDSLQLAFITNRGIKVWPEPWPETFCVDHWRCRFLKKEKLGGSVVQAGDIITLLGILNDQKIEIIKTENLYSFSGQRAYSSIV